MFDTEVGCVRTGYHSAEVVCIIYRCSSTSCGWPMQEEEGLFRGRADQMGMMDGLMRYMRGGA